MADFQKAFKEVFEIEGVFSDHPLDRGGKTKYGITEAVARENGYTGAMEDLPLDEAKRIYKKKYWDVLKLDQVADDQAGIDLFDVSVNMGQKTAGRMLQRALNLLNRDGQSWRELKVDGVIGAKTLGILDQVRGKDILRLHKVLNGLQFMKYVDIVTHDPKQEVFFRGWLRRV